ncbi:MAG: FHA domain-containing protein [Desulfobacterales bacterium]|jgi:pSer/pThr/pTyr-binding forkhead associated (FHA) protein
MMDPQTPPAITVTVEQGKAEKNNYSFTSSFQIGRGAECDVRIKDVVVSRNHAEIRFEQGRWRIYDLKSANAIWVDGEQVEQATLENNTRIRLGKIGPLLSVTIEKIKPTGKEKLDRHSLARYTTHYFGDADDDDIGEHTMMVRRAFAKIQSKQKKKYAGIIAIFALLFLVSGVYAIYKHIQVNKQKALAEDIFYAMKKLELEFAGALKTARLKKDAGSQRLVENYRAQRNKMEENYEQFMNTLDTYGKNISEKERLILRIARTFGECEINIPDGFAKEVMSYIKKWKTKKKKRQLEKAIHRAQRKKYIPKIVETFESYDLPAQFFYLALQESLFDINACGPKTRFGIAKGVWQFIPSTARRYNLRLGPLVEIEESDPLDDRYHFGRSTLAAAKYIRDIYDTEAQASGLLVMASYNWGERRVNKLIRTMPENPRERNFWRILDNYKEQIPKQTYDYVFYIVSAAVIGENPRLFGFDFDNPLASVS